MVAEHSLKIGIVGLDSTHALAFTRLLNGLDGPALNSARVVAACHGHPTDFPLSTQRTAQIAADFRQTCCLPIVDTFAELDARADAFLLLTADGRSHLSEARELFVFGKPVFIDKPMAASLADAREIFRLSELHHVPCFTSSALRFRSGLPALQQAAQERPVHLDISAPFRGEPGHPALLWHSIHAVETIFAVLGCGCRTVKRRLAGEEDVTVATWDDGSTATLLRRPQNGDDFPVTLHQTGGKISLQGFAYENLLQEIVMFFETRRPPVSSSETLELFAMIEAAEVSAAQGGEVVAVSTSATGRVTRAGSENLPRIPTR